MHRIDEVNAISPAEFERRHLLGGRPLIVRGVASTWPAAKWSLAGLRRDFGARELKVQIFDSPSSRLANWRYEVRRLEAYLDEMHTPAGPSQYLTYTTLEKKFPELLPDVELPAFLAPFVRGVGAEKFGIFIGPEGQGTELHYHPILWGGTSQAFAVSLVGRKLFQLYPASDTRNLYPFPLWKGFPKKLNWSQVVKTSPEFPRFADARPIDVELGPGDGLFIPPHWWHATRCLEESISLTLFFPGDWRYKFSPRLAPRDLTIFSAMSLMRAAVKVKGLAEGWLGRGR
ncbi:MAG TPA: cupin-like domain-containing protein [Candidatus Nanopelagicales bacterium]|nr:cupin-like domain-containing protein [Candidatus Nanopelagicales bacterium]